MVPASVKLAPAPVLAASLACVTQGEAVVTPRCSLCWFDQAAVSALSGDLSGELAVESLRALKFRAQSSVPVGQFWDKW